MFTDLYQIALSWLDWTFTCLGFGDPTRGILLTAGLCGLGVGMLLGWWSHGREGVA